MNVIALRSTLLAVFVSIVSTLAVGCGGAGTEARPVANVSAANSPADNRALDRVEHSPSRR